MYLRTLGGLTLEGSDLERPMRLLLLAYLALQGPTPRAEVNEMFSGPSDGKAMLDLAELSKQKAKNLTTALQQIRRVAGDDVIVRSQGTVEVALHCDAVNFEALVASGDLEGAEGLYTGPFLHGIEGMRYMRPDRWDPELAGWVRETRLRIAARALGVLVHLGQMHARLGNVGKATAMAAKAFRTFEATIDFDEYDPGGSTFALDDLQVLHALLALEPDQTLERFRELAGVYVDVRLPSVDQAVDQYVKADEWAEVQSLGPVVGRRTDTERVVAALEGGGGRFVTITGPGGVGKTTLALHVARLHRAEGRYPNGVLFVPLEGVKIPNLVPVRIAAALGVELSVHGDALDQVLRHTRDRRALIVLDNFEHLLERADIPGRLVESGSQLAVIVTSRERLGGDREIVYQLSGLAFDSPTGSSRDEEEGDAVSWFVQAARSRVPAAEFDNTDLAIIARLCRFLDGHPLAIQLAAHLIDIMPLEDIQGRLQANADVLDHAASDMTGRPKSLQATWESSWVALDGADRLPLSSLAVFRGGFTWEAVMHVAEADLAQLKRWIDRSLVQVASGHRLDIHPTLRPLLLAKLSTLDGTGTVAARHAEYFLRNAEEQAARLNGPLARSALGFFTTEHANLQAAWEHEQSAAALLRFSRVLLTAQSRLGDLDSRSSLLTRAREANEREGHAAAVAELTNGIADALLQRGEINAAQSELTQALERSHGPESESVRAETLSQLGGIHYLRREYDLAIQRFEQAQALHELTGDRAQSASELANIGAVHYQKGDVVEAVRIWRTALTGHRRAGDLERQALALNNLGAAYQRLGEFERASVSLEKAKELFGSLGDELGADAANINLGTIAFLRGYYEASRTINAESLRMYRRVGNEQGEALALTNLAMVDERQGSLGAAQAALLEALRLQERSDERVDRAATLYNLSTVTLQLGNVERAIALAVEAIELAAETGHTVGKGYAHMFHGAALLASDAVAAGGPHAYQEAVRCFDAAPDFVGSLTVDLLLSRQLGATGAIQAGIDAVTRVLETAIHHDLLPLAREAATSWASMLGVVGNPHQQAEASARVQDLTRQLERRATSIPASDGDSAE